MAGQDRNPDGLGVWRQTRRFGRSVREPGWVGSDDASGGERRHIPTLAGRRYKEAKNGSGLFLLLQGHSSSAQVEGEKETQRDWGMCALSGSQPRLLTKKH